MSTGPKQFERRRKREHLAASSAGKAQLLPRERVRDLVIATVLGIIAWTYFYSTFGSHQIVSLHEFERYLQGENLYRKYEVSRLSWDCEGLRSQFVERYLADSEGRISRDRDFLVFSKSGLDQKAFNGWTRVARRQLALGHVQKVTNEAMLVPAMMVRLFPAFRFESDEFSRDISNKFNSKCNAAGS